MSIQLLLIQAVGLVGIATFFLSFQCRNNRRLFLVQFLAYVFLSAHMLLLGAVTGGISYIINVLRSACLASRRRALTAGRPALSCAGCSWRRLP